MRVFVTGATGLLGGNLVRLLAQEGHKVKALVRSRAKGERRLGDLLPPSGGVDLVEGDMLDVAAFAPELAGSDVVFHTAAYFREYFRAGDTDGLLRKINVDGTVELLEAAAARGVGSFVHASSGGVLGGSAAGGVLLDESAPYVEDTANLYFRSKVGAEKAIHRWLRDRGDGAVRVVLVLPGAMWGPGDAAPTATGRFVVDFLEHRVPFILPGGLPVVDARDVAGAMARAAMAGESGERYLVYGRYHDMATIVRTLSEVSGVEAPKRRLPYPLAITIAGASETMGRLTGKPPQLSREVVRTLHENRPGSSEKAAEQLRVEFRPLKETLGDTVRWFRKNGYVREKGRSHDRQP